MPANQELTTARDLAIEAGAIALSYFNTDRIDIRAKGNRDVVTAADMASEAFILDALRQAFPEDGVMGEEGTNVAPGAPRKWCIDPLDGTLNFSRGIPFWAVSIALFEEGQPVAGVIHDPITGETFSGQAGGGAWCDDRTLAVSTVSGPDRALVHLTVDFNTERMQVLQVGLEDMRAVAPYVFRTRNMGSAALALAYVAAGRFDAMLHRYAHPWDYGAGVLLVREAGGQVSSMDGGQYDIDTRAVCATSTPSLQRALLDRVTGDRGASVQ